MDRKDCLYCDNQEKRDSMLLYIADLRVSKLYLTKEQTYYGRCVVAYNDHDVELYNLSDEDAAQLMADVKQAGLAVQKTVSPAKVNYGMFSDTLPHLHVHVVPKQKDGYTFGTTFVMHPGEVYLTEDEYAEMIQNLKNNL